MSAIATANSTSTWTIDATHAEVGFAVRHLMISTVRGRFGAIEGTVTLDEANVANSKVDVTIDVTSIDTRQEMRDNHLRSADFFDVEKHPKMHFVSKKISGDVDGELTIVGDLTIKGVTREITLDAEFQGKGRDPWGNDRLGFEAKGKINRTEFGLGWNQALETGGVVVSEEVKLTIEVELIKQASTAAAA
jgi:polyisoprenoid-binding protein YceI